MSTSIRHWLPLLGLLLFAGLVGYLMRPQCPVPAAANASVHACLMRCCNKLGLRVTIQNTSILMSQRGQMVGTCAQHYRPAARLRIRG
ncbi:hypothetical protein [Hymenobacter psoromatis]|uniref:hypothetical protein n=1 Tax=Hymenobacter psoromatis TaxID=1484116 RepID=UPI001CBAEC2D|nr:hypothetical protein [Hymenobacter psoromatis]